MWPDVRGAINIETETALRVVTAVREQSTCSSKVLGDVIMEVSGLTTFLMEIWISTMDPWHRA